MIIIISGKVIKGKNKGRKLSFPTANIKLKDEIESGVYAGVIDVDGKKYKAGIFVSPDKQILEVHLIGFSGDLYGQEIEIEIGDRIREVMKFRSDKKLKEQIKKDIEYICSQV
jgi:riboflavin kinase/FMN adenylyltransferase